MPPLSGPENIRDFIACVAHAMLIGAILGPDGARLLYAAQVAYQASAHAEVKPTSTRGPGRPATRPTPRFQKIINSTPRGGWFTLSSPLKAKPLAKPPYPPLNSSCF
jgi:hypothetical protein